MCSIGRYSEGVWGVGVGCLGGGGWESMGVFGSSYRVTSNSNVYSKGVGTETSEAVDAR